MASYNRDEPRDSQGRWTRTAKAWWPTWVIVAMVVGFAAFAIYAI